METTPVTCNHCGAALQVPDSARFVTCRYCSSQLEIKRTDSTITTEVLARIDQNTASMAQDLHALRQESQLERLDREWAQRRDSLLVRDKQGNTSRPTAAGGVLMAVIMGAFGIFWTILSFDITAPQPAPTFPEMPGFPTPSLPSHEAIGTPPIVHFVFPLFGLIFVAAAIGIGIKTVVNAGRFEQEEALYQQRREDILKQSSSNTSANS